jgi:TonB family protein
VLRETAELLRSHFRSDDIVVRYGGDEFVVLLPEVGATQAGELAERARTAVNAHQFCQSCEQAVVVPVSFSLGVASAPDDGTVGETLLALADQRLLENKRVRHEQEHPRRRAWAALGLAAALTTAVVTLTLLAGRSPEVPGQLPAPVREQQLMQQIRDLKAQIATLALAQTESKDRAVQSSSQTRIATLNARIAELEGELGARLAQTPAVAPEDGDSGVPVEPQPPSAPTPAAAVDHAHGTKVEIPTPIALPVRTLVADEIVPPELVHFTPPAYPALALRSRRETSVTLRVLVSTTGNVLRAERIGPRTGLGFDAAARDAALGARYRPATKNGVPIESETELLIEFRLKSQR